MSKNTPINASIEVVPQQVLNADDLENWFPAGTCVYLPDVGSAPLDVLVASAKRLREAGYEPVPHLPARRIRDRKELELRLSLFREEADISDVLIIGGGLDQEIGEFSSTMDVLDTGLLDNYAIQNIRVAGHPEGSPDFTEEMAIAALRYKQDFNDRTDARLTIVTQFGFDADTFVKWADGLASLGVDLPVHLGVAGPAKLTTLVKFSILCGVGPSLQFLKKRASAISTLVSGFDPEVLVDPIERHVNTHAKSPIEQIHLFPFGGAQKTADWLYKRGSWKRR